MSLEAPRRKRLKIALACTDCRDRKVRCDGAQPICGACARRNASDSCSYQRTSTVFRRQHAPIILRPLNEEGASSSMLSHTSIALPSAVPSSSLEKLRSNYFQSDPVDGLVTIGDNGDDLPYGQSSTVAFVRQVAQGGLQGGKSPGSGPIPRRLKLSSSAAATAPLYSSDESALLLPQRSLADDYMECFWTFLHPVFPILHKTSFMRSYDELWQSTTKATGVDVYFIPMLNLVFALGCQYSELVAVQSKSSVASGFYLRSRKAFTFDILDCNSLSHVQLLLLMGVYLQSSQYASQCWNAVGLAIRSAQGLGLHLDRENSHPSNQVEQEMGRRVWHNCVCLDRLLSMTFGRPPIISTSQVPLPALIDDENLKSGEIGSQPPESLSYLSLFVFSCRLFDILRRVLDTYYTQDIHADPDLDVRGDMVTSALAFSRSLDDFDGSIPEWLKARVRIEIDGASKQNSLHLQQQVLYCRFLYTRLLSLRPLLLLSGKHRVSASLDEAVLSSCCTLCVDAARELIETIYENLDTLYRSSGWHSVYFTFAATTVLLAASKLPGTDMMSTDLVWSKGLSILEHYKDQITSASRAIMVLQTLRNEGRFHRSGQRTLLQTARDTDPGSQLPTRLPSPQLSQFNAFGAASLEDAWFGQQFLNLDWLELDTSTL